MQGSAVKCFNLLFWVNGCERWRQGTGKARAAIIFAIASSTKKEGRQSTMAALCVFRSILCSGPLFSTNFSEHSRPTFFGDHSIHNAARHHAFYSPLGFRNLARLSFRRIAKQRLQVFCPALIGAKVDRKRLYRATALPGAGDLNFASRRGYSNVLRCKAQNPDLIGFLQPSTAFALKANHGCTLPLKSILL